MYDKYLIKQQHLSLLLISQMNRFFCIVFNIKSAGCSYQNTERKKNHFTATFVVIK